MAVLTETSWISCPKCSRRARPGQAYCELCGEHLRAAPPAPAPEERTFQCAGCGAAVRIAAGERTAECAFCGEPYVATAEAAAGRMTPEFILPFAVGKAAAERAFTDWVKSARWFAPGDLAARATLSHLRGVYLPFWCFTGRSDSTWNARIGEHWYETVTHMTIVKGKPVMQTRRVQRTEWYPLAGKFHRFHAGALVCASKGLDRETARALEPFPTAEAVRFAPGFLSGWLCEDYSLEREEAAAQAAEEFRERERREIAGFLPGDAHDGLAVETEFHDVTADLVLLPMWICAWSYGGRGFRFTLNGATGEAHGKAPVSGKRIAALVFAILLALALLVLAALALFHG
jgi:DNA-directed RNA polymerase subunit RPC12/RpoP